MLWIIAIGKVAKSEEVNFQVKISKFGTKMAQF